MATYQSQDELGSQVIVRTKSRLGCRGCKLRKIKCDEKKPGCDRCRIFGIECVYVQPESRDSRPSEHRRVPMVSHKQRRRGRPRRDWAQFMLRSSTSEVESNDSGSGSVNGSIAGHTIQAQQDNLVLSPHFDLNELMAFHHYLSITAPSLGYSHVWRDGAPQLARAYPGIAHAMISISAYHLIKTNVLEAPKNLLLAEKHYTIAARAATAMVADITLDNCQAIYTIASLICFIAFAKGPKPGDLILITNDGSVSWLHLMSGVRAVLRTFGSEVVFTGVLDPTTHAPSHAANCQCPINDYQPRERRFEIEHPGWDWCASLSHLQQLLQALPESDPDVSYRRHVDSITDCFTLFLQRKPPADENKSQDFIAIMTWVYFIDEAFIEALKTKHKIALVILGFFGVLMKSIKGYWFLDGWGNHILCELREILGPVYHEWLP
ncbi:hypothetical protein QWA68_014955 [Fusarium oxysporum]|nr:hypothetical protein QWA68_014955 [Fusarium oxysporum]